MISKVLMEIEINAPSPPTHDVMSLVFLEFKVGLSSDIYEFEAGS